MKKNLHEYLGISIIVAPFIMCFISVLLIYGAFAGGYVCMVLYKWFLIPYIPNLPIFNLWQFAGFMLFVSALYPRSDMNFKSNKDGEVVALVSKAILRPWLTLLSAWIVKEFIHFLS